MPLETEFRRAQPEQQTENNPETIHDNLPENLEQITPYEKVRPLDYDYEHLNDLESLTTEQLQQKVEEYEAMPEHREFNDLHLNFNQLDKMVDAFSEFAEENQCQELSQQLAQIVKDIKYSSSRYYKSVMVFDRTAINKFRMEEFEFKENMKNADQARRIAHNRLIDAITNLAKICYKTIPEATGYKFNRSQLFDQHLILDLRSENQNLHNPARKKVANWAFINERGIHIQKSVERAKELINKKTA